MIKKWRGVFLFFAFVFVMGICNNVQAETGANGQVNVITIQPNDNKILVGGEFKTYNGVIRNGIVRLNSNGTLDTSFKPVMRKSSWVGAIAVQPNDGRIIVGGYFTNYDGSPATGVIRLNSDGTVDTTFNSGAGADSYVTSIAIQSSDRKIIIGGSFNNYNGTARKGVARLNTNGTLDMTFNPGIGVSGGVSSIAIQSDDNKIIIGGQFTSYNGTIAKNIARINTDGKLDSSFNSGNSGCLGVAIKDIAIQTHDNKIIIVGDFISYNGIARKNIARLNTDGTLDAIFNPGSGPSGQSLNGEVMTVDFQTVGTEKKILIGGAFIYYNGVARGHIARINSNGTLDISFNPGSGANNVAVMAVVTQSADKILFGGNFTSYNGSSLNRVGRLNSNGMVDASFGKTDWENYGPREINCLPIFDLYTGSQEQKDNLVIIAHGWNDSANADWAVDMRNYIIAHTNSNETAVGRFDWKDSAATGVNPWQAYSNAFDQGRCLANRILALHINPKNIHLIGHSAGANIIQTAVDELVLKYKNNSNRPFVHLTFLDAFAPGGEAERYGDFSSGGSYGYGFSGYAEHYVDIRLLGPDAGNFDSIRYVLDSTHSPLKNAVNFDVTSLDKDFIETIDPLTNWNWYHKWPIKVYNDSVLRQDYYKMGFPYSMEQNFFQEDYYPEALRGHWCQVEEFDGAIQNRKCMKMVSATEAGASFVENNIVQPAKDVTNAIIESVETSTTGVINFISELNPVTLIPDSINNDFNNIIHFQTGSPSWMKFNLTITKPVNFLEFKSLFPVQGGSGVFAVFVDDEKIFSRQADLSEVGRIYQDRAGFPEVLTEGNHTIILRLDPIAEDKSDIYIADVNLGMQSVDVGDDDIAPATDLTADGNANLIWFRSDVQVTLSATDNEDGSGVDKTEYSFDDGASWLTYTAPFTISNEGIHIIKYRSIDKAGNVEDAQSAEIKIDKTAPTININTPKEGGKYILNSVLNADWSATDDGSSIENSNGTLEFGSLINTSFVGEKTFEVNATDKAGNSNTKNVKYYVAYDFSGFQGPVAEESKTFNSNSTIPITFQLTDTNGNYIQDATASLRVDEKDAIASGESNEGNVFRYDALNNQYIFNLSLKELSLESGMHKLRIGLNDGTDHEQSIIIK